MVELKARNELTAAVASRGMDDEAVSLKLAERLEIIQAERRSEKESILKAKLSWLAKSMRPNDELLRS